jgi:hypothetical protein
VKTLDDAAIWSERGGLYVLHPIIPLVLQIDDTLAPLGSGPRPLIHPVYFFFARLLQMLDQSKTWIDAPRGQKLLRELCRVG